MDPKRAALKQSSLKKAMNEANVMIFKEIMRQSHNPAAIRHAGARNLPLKHSLTRQKYILCYD